MKNSKVKSVKNCSVSVKNVLSLFFAVIVFVLFSILSMNSKLFDHVDKLVIIKEKGSDIVIKLTPVYSVSVNYSTGGNTSQSENMSVVRTRPTVRPNKCNLCFQNNFSYVIQNRDICKINESGQSIDLIILIFTTHQNVENRSALRDTWLTITKNNTAHIRYAFLLGETSDNKLREAVFKENQHFHDIVKADFIDTYMNLTYKTIMGFKWATTQCAHAHYVMKTDDDMYVNVPNLKKVYNGPNKSKMQSSVMGACYKTAKPIRDKKSKWFASEYSYPEKYYPGFCSGTGYVTSMRVATEVFKISSSVPFFHLEDVYVSLCIKRLGFTLTNVPGFNPGKPALDPCVYKGSKLITAHRLSPGMIRSVWKGECKTPRS